MSSPSQPELTPADIVPGGRYRGKRVRRGLFGDPDDRVVLWVNEERTRVQYDSISVRPGRRYPTISMEAFLKWAREKV